MVIFTILHIIWIILFQCIPPIYFLVGKAMGDGGLARDWKHQRCIIGMVFMYGILYNDNFEFNNEH